MSSDIRPSHLARNIYSPSSTINVAGVATFTVSFIQRAVQSVYVGIITISSLLYGRFRRNGQLAVGAGDSV
jgi:hypothetical protein